MHIATSQADLRDGGFPPKSCVLHCSNEAILAGDSIGTAAEVKLKIQAATSKTTSAKIPVGFVKFERTFSEEAAIRRMRSRSNKLRWPSYNSKPSKMDYLHTSGTIPPKAESTTRKLFCLIWVLANI